jgi:hypothetical protein
MRTKINLWFCLAIIFFSTTGFKSQETPIWNGPVNWAALAVIFAIIFLVALLILYQSFQTSSAVARYHLDHAEPGHEQAHEDVHPEESEMHQSASH